MTDSPSKKKEPARPLTLYEGVEKKSFRVIKFWLEDEKVDINVASRNGLTAMHAAAKLEDPKIARYLHECGAFLDSSTNSGSTPLLFSIKSRNIETAFFFIQAGSEIDLPNNELTTPLLLACQQKTWEICKMLIVYNADVNKSSVKGTPLHFASLYGSLDIVKMLVQKGANIEEKERATGRGALAKAVTNGHYQVCRYLLDQGANVNIQDRKGRKPIHVAAAKGFTEIITLLLNRNADIESLDKDKNTPLHKAAKYNHPDSYALLIKKGANYKSKNVQGKLARVQNPPVNIVP